MAKYRKNLPQAGEKLFLTDGGLETTLIFHEGLDLPCFASFDLLKDEEGRATLRRYFLPYLEIARRCDAGMILEAPTWRANPEWAAKLGYDAASLADANRRAIELMVELRTAHEQPSMPVVISGNIGPRGDGYRADGRMSAQEAFDYHRPQIGIFAQSEADLVSAFTINYVEEAIGIIRAARDADMPVVISYTVETDGRLPSGQALGSAILQSDAETDGYVAYYMINCAHPTHFADVLEADEAWRHRIRGLRANASTMSHAELDECSELDAGDPADLGDRYRELRRLLPELNVLGGCCGTDHRHVDAIARACRPSSRPVRAA